MAQGRGRGEGKKVNAALGKGITDKRVLECNHLREGLLVLCQHNLGRGYRHLEFLGLRCDGFGKGL